MTETRTDRRFRFKPLMIAICLECAFNIGAAAEVGLYRLDREAWFKTAMYGPGSLAMFGLGPWP